MISSRALCGVLIAGTVLLGATLLHAAKPPGVFNVDLTYHIWPDSGLPSETQVIITATAKYKGDPGPDETRNWQLETFLNDSIGNDLDDWESPDWETPLGTSMVGEGIYNGLEVTCGLNCGASGNVPNCDANDQPVLFKGSGLMAILAVFGEDKVYRTTGDAEETTCTYSVGGTVPELPAKDRSRVLVLRLNGWSTWDVVMTRKGNFTFEKELPSGDPYEVTVAKQPYDYKKCYAENGSGVISNNDVNDIVIRCVNHCRARRGSAYYPGGFEEVDAVCYPATLVDRGDGTAADEANNLLWSKTLFGTDGNSAQTACGSVSLAGRTDWYLPDVAQLQTLLPPGVCHSALDGCGDGDPDMPYENGPHWSSTHPYLSEYCPRGFGCPNAFWLVHTGLGTYFGHYCYEPGCPPAERVYWKAVNDGGGVRCVTDLH